MKIVILAIIAGVLGFIGYSYFRGECRDGRVVATEVECVASFGADSCRLAFAESRKKATEEYAPFNTQDSCQRSFPRCEPHRAVVSGFVPVPSGTCVARVDGRVSGTPVYERIGRKF